METLPAIVAAAGLSSRMGTSKALLDAGGATFLARVIDSLAQGGGDPIVVVVRDLGGGESREAEALGAVPVLNPNPDPGPISSLQAGIRSLKPDAPAILFTPVDHPLFLPSTVRTLVEAFRKTQPALVAPSHGGKPGHPVVFGRGLFPELLQGELPHGARTVVRRHLDERILVPVDDPGILADIDTPDDYRRWLSSE